MEHKHGCIVLHHGKIMASGYNYDKVQFNVQKCISCSTHAEMAAILGLKGKKGDTIIVVRIGKDGKLKDSMPCTFCYNYIQNAGIKKIYYSTNNDDIICIKTKLINIDKLRLSKANLHIQKTLQSRDVKLI